VAVGLDAPIFLPALLVQDYHGLPVAPLECKPLLAGLRGS
jgi:hypothetical protein